MKILHKIKLKPYQKKFLISILVFLIVFTIAGFFIIPPLLKSYLINTLSEKFHREIFIKDLKINPFVLSINVKGFVVKDREVNKPFISFDELYVNLQSLSLLKKGVIVKEIKLDKPYANIVRHLDKSYNFSDLLKKKSPPPTSEKGSFRFSINNIQISGGRIDFLDKPKDTSHELKDIMIAIPFLSNLPYNTDTYVNPAFEANLNGKPVNFYGQTKPFAESLDTTFNIDVKDFNIPYYLSYIPLTMNFTIQSAFLDTKGTIIFRQYRDRPPSIDFKGNIVLKEIIISKKAKDKTFLTIPEFFIKGIEFDFSKKSLTFVQITTNRGTILIERNKDGMMNIENLVHRVSTEKEEAQQQKDKSDKKWKIQVTKIRFDQYALNFHDIQPSEPVTIIADHFNLNVDDFSTAENRRGTIALSLALNKKGTVTTKGEITIDPLSVKVSIDMQNMDIMPIQSYFTDKVKILVTKGTFRTKGDFFLDYSKGRGFTIKYKGMMSLSNFASVDKAYGDDFLKWKSLHLSGMNIGYPLSVEINKVDLTDFYSRLIINSDGTLNIQKIFKDKEDGKAQTVQPEKKEAIIEKKTEQAKPIKIETVTLNGGIINFTDRYIKPQFSANFHELGGQISGLTSEEKKVSDVDLKGNLENYAPIEIKGKINPLRKDLYVDIRIDFKDIELSPLTPYAGKYIGYTVEKGKLFLDMQYLIVKRKLDAQHNLFLDKFTLGDKVESPNATKLPVKLAIALLKNRKGEIDLDIPVTGSLDDPEFSVGRIVLKILINILTKAATSPFALLGAIFGGGEELSYVEFDYGKNVIPEAEKKKLDTLIKALYERPTLKLEMTGHVDMEKDREGLKQYLFKKKIQAQKLKEMVKNGVPAVPVDTIEITPDEYPIYLKMAYKKEKFKKLRTFLGFLKDLPIPEMEKLMLTHIEITDDDLRLLASERVLNTKDYILKSNEVQSERIFLVEPDSLEPKEEKKLKKSRVEFILK